MDGFVLAGGRSTRMGFDKARASWGGVALAVAAAESLRGLCERVALIRRGADGMPWRWADETDLEVVMEAVDSDHHPLWGVVTAIRAARSELVAVVPCDVPGVRPASWRALADRAPAVAVDETGRTHPLVAVFDRRMAARAEELARDGAPAHRLAEECARVVVAAEELADHDEPDTVADPVAALLERVPAGDPLVRARIAEGEAGRLRARGILPKR